MKKILALTFVLLLTVALSVSSFAATKSPSTTTIAQTDAEKSSGDFPSSNTDTCDVDVKIVNTAVLSVYNVTIAWDSLDFTFTFANTNVWNPADHTYGGTGGSWANNDGRKITVTNHSNEDVYVTASMDTYTANGVTAKLNGTAAAFAKTKIDTGVGLTYTTADKEEISVTVEGIPTIESDFSIGTITVTITAS